MQILNKHLKFILEQYCLRGTDSININSVNIKYKQSDSGCKLSLSGKVRALYSGLQVTLNTHDTKGGIDIPMINRFIGGVSGSTKSKAALNRFGDNDILELNRDTNKIIIKSDKGKIITVDAVSSSITNGVIDNAKGFLKKKMPDENTFNGDKITHKVVVTKSDFEEVIEDSEFTNFRYYPVVFCEDGMSYDVGYVNSTTVHQKLPYDSIAEVDGETNFVFSEYLDIVPNLVYDKYLIYVPRKDKGGQSKSLLMQCSKGLVNKGIIDVLLQARIVIASSQTNMNTIQQLRNKLKGKIPKV